jgi:hypothetical protein
MLCLHIRHKMWQQGCSRLTEITHIPLTLYSMYEKYVSTWSYKVEGYDLKIIDKGKRRTKNTKSNKI